MRKVRGLELSVSVSQFMLTRALGGLSSSVVYGALSGLSFVSRPRPQLPGPEWVRLEVIACGICGSDLGTLTFKGGASLEPFASFPAVLGHEIVATVIEVGAGVEHVALGARVAVDPIISCDVRGYERAEWCPNCRDGWAATCLRSGDEGKVCLAGKPLARGKTIGYHSQLCGGWADELVAHRSQLHVIPVHVSDRTAALIEPLSVGLHAALGVIDALGDTVLVVGGGPIALATIWALRALGWDGVLVVQARHAQQGELAMRLGATHVVQPGAQARDAAIQVGAKPYKPIIGPEVMLGGFAAVIDCAGTAESFNQALHFTRERGQLVLLGCAGQVGNVDLTFLWAKEIRVKGFVCYGLERWQGQSIHTFDLAMQLLQGSSGDVQQLVTGSYALDRYKVALGTLFTRHTSGAIKVLLSPL